MKHRGFSLVEVIVYAAIAVVLLGAVVAGVVSLTNTMSVIRADYALSRAASLSFETISREARNAISIDNANSTFGSSPGRLTLNTKDSGGSNITVEFYVSNGVLQYRNGAGAPSPLHGSSTAVTQFIVRSVPTNNSTALRFDLAFQVQKGTSLVTESFFASYLIRGSY